jgi:hypothetical protein
MNTVFDIEQKQDSAEKMAAVAGKETKYILFAGEFNDVARKALEAAVENVKVDFSWSNKPEHFSTVGDKTLNYIIKTQLLVMNFRAQWMLDNTDEVWLLIDRYKPKRKVRVNTNQLKNSGFKKAIYPDELNPNRPSELLIANSETILDFGQKDYFNIQPQKISSKGCRFFTFDGTTGAFQYLQFRIKVKKGDTFFFSKPKATLKMICKGNLNNAVISYKLQ